jgi:hypothetical protein
MPEQEQVFSFGHYIAVTSYPILVSVAVIRHAMRTAM